MSAHAAPAERLPGGLAAPPGGELERGHPRERGGPLALSSARVQVWAMLLISLVLCLVAFVAKGGLSPETMTSVEIGLTLGSGIVVAGAVLLAPADRRVYGAWAAGLLLAFTALTTVSVVWSVQPDASWQDAGRLLAYSGVFGTAVALVRVTPERWPALLGAVVLSAVVVCGYALLTKVLPDQLGADSIYARLQEPYGYWNATGLSAAMGIVGCMWLGARRSGHAVLSALAYPAMGIMAVTLMLAYSRGALAAVALGVALWFCIVPLRLRGAAVLIVGALGAAPVVVWVFSDSALSTDSVGLAQRVSSGHQLGVLLAAMLLVLTFVGVAVGFFGGRRAPSRAMRRQVGTLLLSMLVLAALAFLALLTTSHRGLTGSISHGVSSLTDPHARVPPNSPSRLAAIGSVRARYWNEALKVFQDHPVQGAGAAGYETARLRYRTETLDVKHAHGYIVQTLADLGLIGLAITLALLAVWLAAAGQATHPLGRRWQGGRWRGTTEPYAAERVGLLSMLCLVVVFGIHSFADWTWYVPGNACVALLCAGWLAGRGPLAPGDAGDRTHRVAAIEPAASGAGALRRRRLALPALGPVRLSVAGVVVVAALLASWAEWQPQRSVDASNEALALVARNPSGALAAAQAGVDRDPLSAQALLTLAAIQQGAGQSTAAHATLQRAVHLQPSNPETWVALGEFDLGASNPKGALNDLRAAIYLDPEAIAAESVTASDPELLAIRNNYLRALRETGTGTGGTTTGAVPGTGTGTPTNSKARPLGQ